MDVEIHLLTGSLLIFGLSIVLAIARHAETLPEISLSYKFKNKSFKKERRVYPRYKASLGIKYKTPATEGISWVSDVSRGGLRLFLSDKIFEIGNVLQLEISLPGDTAPIFAKGNIAWVKNDEAGINFNEVKQDDINRIIHYTGNREQIRSLKKYQFI
ncbi:MAG: PilZ domain-containing protein [Candidatus Omnitrophica bacterium]|nr:PilZ domain-containing protein [Candidatus Omnitrophota bacterium]